MPENKYGYCQCGCGQKTNINGANWAAKGWIKGKPKRFIHGHNAIKEEIRKNGRGYILILNHGHHRSDVDGYVLEHILVMEKSLGRPIARPEVIHHINGDRSDNSLGNLMLFATNNMHISYHKRVKAFKLCGYYDWEKCPFCLQYDSPANMFKSIKRFYHQSCRKLYHDVYYRKNRDRILRKQRENCPQAIANFLTELWGMSEN